jgi:hypothetical protein
MKKVLPIVFLIALGAISYAAYVVVTNNNVSSLQQQLTEANAKNADLTSRLEYAGKSSSSEKQSIHDVLVVALPHSKEVIDGAFHIAPATQPTTIPTTQSSK